MRNKSTVAVCTILAVLVLPVVADAQPPAAAMNRASASTLAARVEQRLNRQHAEFAITPGEEALWTQYAQVTRANARDMSALFAQRKAALSSMNATDNMHSLAAIAAQHARAMQRLDAAFTALYAAMPPAQQHTTDAAIRAYSLRSRP